MVYIAVLAGCGAMAKGWLKALSETPELRGRVCVLSATTGADGAVQFAAPQAGL